MAAHQCPNCPLRFSYRTELDYHLREDHAPTVDVAQGPAPVLVGAAGLDGVAPAPRAAPPAAMRAGPTTLTWSATEPGRARSAGPPVAPAARAGPEPPPPKIGLMPRWVVLAMVGALVVVLVLGMVGG